MVARLRTPEMVGPPDASTTITWSPSGDGEYQVPFSMPPSAPLLNHTVVQERGAVNPGEGTVMICEARVERDAFARVWSATQARATSSELAK